MKDFLHFTNNHITLPYFITSPEKPEDNLPLIVFLHGAGERGDSESLVRIHGIPKYFGASSEYNNIRAITLSPECPTDKTWVELSEDVMELILRVSEEYKVDKTKISLTGISMGGFGTWEMLCKYPDFFFRAAPICGGGMSWRIFTKTPVRAFHGDSDMTVPIEYSYLMSDALNQHGGKCELTVYHGCNHDSWSRTYEQTDIIAWLAGNK